MEYYGKLLTVFLVFISIFVLIKCEEKNQVLNSVPNLPVPHYDEDSHLTTTKINMEPSKGVKLSPALKKIFNENHNSIENESTELNKKVPLPLIWYKQWAPSELHSGMIKNPMNLNEAISYSDLPHLHALNHIPPVISLPAIYPKYYNNMIPYQKHVDELDSQNLFMSHTRPVRSSEEELLAQLSHDAVMENILPTMPFPYFRTISLPSYYKMPYAQFHDAHMMAVFPCGNISDCAIPLLFMCSPQITRGTISEDPSYGDVFNPEPVAPVTYQTYERTDSGSKELTASLNLGHIIANANTNVKE